MATPTTFKEQNFKWVGWPADDKREEVGDLPAYRDPNDAEGATISCWRLGWGERLAALMGGRVWLHVQGPQPPVYLSSEDPFA